MLMFLILKAAQINYLSIIFLCNAFTLLEFLPRLKLPVVYCMKANYISSKDSVIYKSTFIFTNSHNARELYMHVKSYKIFFLRNTRTQLGHKIWKYINMFHAGHDLTYLCKGLLKTPVFAIEQTE